MTFLLKAKARSRKAGLAKRIGNINTNTLMYPMSLTRSERVPVPQPVLSMYEQPTDRYAVVIETPRGIYYRRKYLGPDQEVFWDAYVTDDTDIRESFLAAYRLRNELVRVNFLDPNYGTAKVLLLNHATLYPHA